MQAFLYRNLSNLAPVKTLTEPWKNFQDFFVQSLDWLDRRVRLTYTSLKRTSTRTLNDRCTRAWEAVKKRTEILSEEALKVN